MEGVVIAMLKVVLLFQYAYLSASTAACEGCGAFKTCDAGASACTSSAGYCTNNGLHVGVTANHRGSLLQVDSRIHQHKTKMLSQAALGNVKQGSRRHSGTKVMDESSVAREMDSQPAGPERVEIRDFEKNRQRHLRNAANDEEEPRDMIFLQEHSERVYDKGTKGGVQEMLRIHRVELPNRAPRDTDPNVQQGSHLGSSQGKLVNTRVSLSAVRASSDRALLNKGGANMEALKASLDHSKDVRKQKRHKILYHRKSGEATNFALSGKFWRAVIMPGESENIIHHKKELVNAPEISDNSSADDARKIADSNSDDTNATRTFKAENNTAPAGSQLQLAVVDEYAQGIVAKLRSLREVTRKGGGLRFTFFIVCAVVLILFIWAAVRYNHPYFKDEQKKYHTDDYHMLLAASNANYDTHASLKATDTHSTPIPRKHPGAPADKFVSPQRVRLHPIPRQLCPGLVVPQGNECILAVPIFAQSSLEPITAHVKDMEGKCIIQVDVLSASALREHSPERPLAMLRGGGAHGNHHIPQAPLLGYCVACWSMGKVKAVSIYQAAETSHDEDEFARVQKESPNTYTVMSHAAGSRLLFQGDFRNHSIAVTNDKHELLAETTPHMMHFDPSGVYYKLRVVAGVDVGLILFAMYSINCMEFD